MSVEQTGLDQTVTDASRTRPSLSIGSLIVASLAIGLLIGGFFVMAYAFGMEGSELAYFTGGLLMSCLGCFMAFSWLPSRER